MKEHFLPTVVHSIAPELRRLWREDGVFEASLGYTIRLCLRNQMKEGRNEGREGDRKRWERRKEKDRDRKIERQSLEDEDKSGVRWSSHNHTWTQSVTQQL